MDNPGLKEALRRIEAAGLERAEVLDLGADGGAGGALRVGLAESAVSGRVGGDPGEAVFGL